MSCASCAVTIDKVLESIEGVNSAKANFASEKVLLNYNPEKITLEQIQKKITDLGYEIIINDESQEDDVDEDQVKLLKARKNVILSSILSGTIMLLMIIHMFLINIPAYLSITAVLAFPIIFGTGLHVHKRSIKAILNKSANMDVLVTLGSLLPYLVGLLGFFFPAQTFIEMAAAIMTLHLVGKYLETLAKGKASQAIKKLVNMGAKTATVLIDEAEVEVPVKELKVGDIMIIRPGEKIPTDGVVIEGKSLVDESMATGEPMPVKREEGNEVIGATINKNGMLKVRATKVGKDTFLSQVIKLVQECQGTKVPVQEFADRVTSYFVPAIIVLTILTFISFNVFSDFHISIMKWGESFLPWVNAELPVLTLALIASTAVLVIACPCALGLGTPTALMVGTGMGAENGILIRNGESIQTFKEIKCIAFDKTGTITKGKPEITDLIPVNGISEDKLLYYCAGVEKASEHPLASAIVDMAKSKNVHLGDVKDFTSLSGLGVKGKIDGVEIFLGNRKLMSMQKVDFNKYEDIIADLEREAKTAIMVLANNKLIGIIAISDPLKDDSIRAIKELERMGIKTAMITGDNSRTALAIAKKTGISNVIPEVLPDGKVDEIIKLQKKYNRVAMVGDGINDAPALKQANIGIAIGTGTDIAIESADITLVRGELGGIISAIKLSFATFKKIKENYFWAWFYNAVAIPVAMLGLLHPMIGAGAMSLSSLNVVYNSLRLKKIKI